MKKIIYQRVKDFKRQNAIFSKNLTDLNRIKFSSNLELYEYNFTSATIDTTINTDFHKIRVK